MGFVHELHIADVRSAPDRAGARESLVHSVAYYTVQRVPRP